MRVWDRVRFGSWPLSLRRRCIHAHPLGDGRGLWCSGVRRLDPDACFLALGGDRTLPPMPCEVGARNERRRSVYRAFFLLPLSVGSDICPGAVEGEPVQANVDLEDALGPIVDLIELRPGVGDERIGL